MPWSAASLPCRPRAWPPDQLFVTGLLDLQKARPGVATWAGVEAGLCPSSPGWGRQCRGASHRPMPDCADDLCQACADDWPAPDRPTAIGWWTWWAIGRVAR